MKPRKRLIRKAMKLSRKCYSDFEMVGPFAVIPGYKFFTNMKKFELVRSEYQKYLYNSDYRVALCATDYRNHPLGNTYVAIYKKEKGLSQTLEQLQKHLFENILTHTYDEILMNEFQMSDEEIKKRAQLVYEKSMRGDGHEDHR